MFYNEDPRRLQPLVDFIMNAFHTMDFNGESSFDALKVLSLFTAVYEELNWKFSAWTDEVLDRYWPQIHSEHDDVSHVVLRNDTISNNVIFHQVRAHVGEFLAFSGKIKV